MKSDDKYMKAKALMNTAYGMVNVRFKSEFNKPVCRFCKQPITEGIYTTVNLSSGNYLVICDDCRAKLNMYLDQLAEGD